MEPTDCIADYILIVPKGNAPLFSPVIFFFFCSSVKNVRSISPSLFLYGHV